MFKGEKGQIRGTTEQNRGHISCKGNKMFILKIISVDILYRADNGTTKVVCREMRTK